MTQATILLAGPTASGKSDLAIALAEAFDGVIINADSMQVYRDFRLLTARPTAEQEARVPHRLYGVLPITETCSAGRWATLALDEIDRVAQAGKTAIVTGGTGLYFRALTDGLAPIPEIPGEVRNSVRALYRRLGPTGFRAALARLDPESASRIAAGDRQRLMRALEVVQATGRSLAEWQRAPAAPPRLAGPRLMVVLDPPRRVLYQRADARFDAMMAAGALDEVRAVARTEPDPDLPAMRALGVPSLMAHVRGELSLETAIAGAKTATRRYAKRQQTWFRHQIREAIVESAQDLESLKENIFPKICRFLLTTS